MNVLKNNIGFLFQQNQQLAASIAEDSGGKLSIHQAKSGLPTACVNSRYLHSAYDPLREAERWAEQRLKECRPGETIVVLGVGLLYHVQALQQRLPREQGIMVVVPDLSEFSDCVSVRALEGWGEHVRWVTGSVADAVTQVTQSAKRMRMLMYEPAARLHHEFYEQFQVRLRERLSQQLSGTLHVSVVGPMYGGSLPVAGYVVQALKSLGHRVSWIDHSPHYAGYRSLDTIRDHRLRQTVQQRLSDTLGVISLAHIAEDPPDLLLALSQAPLSLAVLEQMRRKKVLTAMWFVENFRHLTYWRQMVTGYDFWFVMQQHSCLQAFKQAGASQVSYLPLAAEPAIHTLMQLTSEERREFGADVSFLGAGYKNRQHLLPSLLGHEWTFKLWGNEWDESGALQAVLQREGARIDTPTSVKIFNATSVNINVHSYTGEGFDPEGDGVNPRTFELASCGAFQIVDTRTLLPALFDESMMAVIKRPDELLPAVRAYLHEPAQRKAMAESSRKRILEAHTYQHRMKTLLGAVGTASPDRLGAILQGDRQADALISRSGHSPELIPLLAHFSPTDRVELVDMADTIRKKGPEAKLSREELLILMMDEYRQEKRDFL